MVATTGEDLRDLRYEPGIPVGGLVKETWRERPIVESHCTKRRVRGGRIDGTPVGQRVGR